MPCRSRPAGLIRELLQAPAHRQRQLIERHYTPDCRLTHALVSPCSISLVLLGCLARATAQLKLRQHLLAFAFAATGDSDLNLCPSR